MNGKSVYSTQWTLLAGGCCMLLAVVFGAFGAHALHTKLPEKAFNAFQTGVHYQIYHALGLVALGILMQLLPAVRLLRWSALCMFLGIILFSGSLYLLALTDIKIFGPITPLGGLLLITSWLLFVAGVFKGN
jgi:uncharacterized membrane protein YgdD (TMEM256/DUF423 family)